MKEQEESYNLQQNSSLCLSMQLNTNTSFNLSVVGFWKSKLVLQLSLSLLVVGVKWWEGDAALFSPSGNSSVGCWWSPHSASSNS